MNQQQAKTSVPSPTSSSSAQNQMPQGELGFLRLRPYRARNSRGFFELLTTDGGSALPSPLTTTTT